jgi:hypothetical protein
MMKRKGNQYYSRSLNQWIEVEHELMHQALTGKDIDPYFANNENYLLFPYCIEDNNQVCIISSTLMEKKYPKAWTYLNQHENKTILRGRDKGEFLQREDWYGYGRPQNMHLLGASKIVLPDVANRGEFTYDSEGRYIIDTCYAIIFNQCVQFSLSGLTAIFNSSIMTFFLNQTGTDLRGGYFRMKTAYLNPFPIPSIQFITQPENRQSHVQHLISLYNQFQSDDNCEPILQQVAHHLNQEPEEADVIHDLLAHLAEQMIEMNQEKQAEIKSFLKWLGREIGCEIDNLTNKTKIKNYLGDYQRTSKGDLREPHLSLEDLLKVLKQNQKKLICDPSARKFQETLETEYQASLDKLLPLKNKLMRCDKLIDDIVYKLYGLTEEEIAIVEERNG